ncbi:MAG: hypothetical protein E6R03_08725 [Hyphomicrobiaceae bacterium]|nr:MAG: hypothetical protein E6R03_08725 [Hyphomicrobiaceae bacterium]
MKIERVEAKLYHCGRMARALRSAHKDVLISHALDTHRDLRHTFAHSMMREAWLLDGRLVAMAGITGSMLDTEGDVWMALSDDAEKHPFAVARHALDYLRRASVIRRSLVTAILTDDEKSVQFAYFLGFSIERRETIKGVKTQIMSFGARKAA